MSQFCTTTTTTGPQQYLGFSSPPPPQKASLKITIFAFSIFNRYSTSVYLLVLAVSDTLSLWVAVPKLRYIYLFDGDFMSLSYIHCKFVDWIGLSSAAVSTSTVVNLTIERVLLTMYPIKAKLRLTPKISIFVSMATVLMIQFCTAHLMFSHTFSGMDVVNSKNVSRCVLSSERYARFYKTAWKFIILIFFNLLPAAIIITGNALIGTLLLKRKRKIYPKLSTNPHNLAQEKKALKMLFAISLFFIIFNSPHWLYLIVRATSTRKLSPEAKAVDQLIQAIFCILLFINRTANFVLYFAKGSLFREECKEIATSLKRRFPKSSQRRGLPDEHRPM